ncbi:efflux RND transporter permease subunit [Candidatus Hydrogenedentota bacterium]
MESDRASQPGASPSFIDRTIRFCLENKIVVLLFLVFIVGWGVMSAPFDWEVGGLPRSPVPVDAIPDIGENQQIVFTEWMGRSPQDVEDQISYPMTVSLLGLPGIKTIRSYSMFGFSMIYVIFEDGVDFYWSRTRILEKLNSLPAGTLPEGVSPALGPDATALGQIFWYTLEGRDPDGNPVGGWDLHELRSIQDWQVRYSLLSARGISEVGSVGGFVQEYQIDVDPDAMRAYGVKLEEVFMAVKMSNVDVGARTIEVNNVEYVIRGLGFIENVDDINRSVIKVRDNVPVYIENVANVTLGPAIRRGALDKGGTEAVGGVVVVRYGFNPLEAIKNVKKKIEEVSPGLPSKAVIDYDVVTRTEVETFASTEGFGGFDGPEMDQEAWLEWLRANDRKNWPEWITTSKVTVIPFYDRAGLIYETLGTLNSALSEEILVTIIVVLFAVLHLRSSILISGILPLAVLLCFIAMKAFGVDANIVALSGIAIAIGTIVDIGIIVCENILKHLDAAPDEDRLEVIYRATSEVGSAILTAVSTTVVSFLPVFTMIAAEGKLFKPLAFTKTFALVASAVLALTVIPPLAHILFAGKVRSKKIKRALMVGLILVGVAALFKLTWWIGLILILWGGYNLLGDLVPARIRESMTWLTSGVAIFVVGIILTQHWLPLGPAKGLIRNFIFVAVLIGGLLLFFRVFQSFYGPILRWCLANKTAFMCVPVALVVLGAVAWMGFDTVFGFVPQKVRNLSRISKLAHAFPGLGKEFMPSLDEGSFLYMPTTMPHAGLSESLDVLQKQDMGLSAIPEVDSVVGKIGRAETPLDPAPVSMVETVINYKPEYITDKGGHRVKFRYDKRLEEFARDNDGELIPDPDGRPYRQWRDHIRNPDDIWEEILKAAQMPGSTSAPKLQPIATRIVMMQSGMRAPMGVKVKGPDLDTIERVGLDIERLLKEIPSVEASAVFADRIVGKPYLELDINRDAVARYGLKIRQVQDVIEVAVGGRRVTTTVEGRERYPVRVRYPRELRDTIETLGRVLVPAPDGTQIPLIQLADIEYVRGPQVIKSEDTFLIGYVLFDMKPGHAEVNVVEDCQRYLKAKLDSGEFVLPAGVSYTFAGSYENQIRSQKTLSIVLPLALFIIFMILYFQFKSIPTTFMVFSGILVAWSGGFILIWLYGQPWFLNFSVFGTDMRELFQVHTINLSVAIWVGFLALFGIASDNGVVIATYLDQSFAARKPRSVEDVREATVMGAVRRIRPCLMTSATTILALIPILTSTGRGSDVMVPMAIPSFGGMLVVLVSVFVVPVLYCAVQELCLSENEKKHQ